jgi:hypothetical protein
MNTRIWYLSDFKAALAIFVSFALYVHPNFALNRFRTFALCCFPRPLILHWYLRCIDYYSIASPSNIYWFNRPPLFIQYIRVCAFVTPFIIVVVSYVICLYPILMFIRSFRSAEWRFSYIYIYIISTPTFVTLHHSYTDESRPILIDDQYYTPPLELILEDCKFGYGYS